MTVRVAVDASCLAWAQSGTRRYTELVLAELARDSRLALHLVTNSSQPIEAFGLPETARRQKGAVVWRERVLRPTARRTADVLWSPWLRPVLLPLGVPHVLTVMDLSPVMHPGTKPWHEVLAMRTTGRWGVHRAARTVTISHATARELETRWHVDPANVEVIHLAADPRFTTGDRQRSLHAVAERWGLRRPFVLAVGTVEPRKGYDLLPALAAALPEVEVVVVGRAGPRSADLVPRLSAACRLLPGVSDDELVHLYRAAEVLLAPSVYEGFGLTPLEAMACGTPAVVAAGAGALEEVYGGVAPVVPRRTAAWAAAVREVRAARDEHVARSSALVASRSWGDVAREVADVLIAVAEGRGPRR